MTENNLFIEATLYAADYVRHRKDKTISAIGFAQWILDREQDKELNDDN